MAHSLGQFEYFIQDFGMVLYVNSRGRLQYQKNRMKMVENGESCYKPRLSQADPRKAPLLTSRLLAIKGEQKS